MQYTAGSSPVQEDTTVGTEASLGWQQKCWKKYLFDKCVNNINPSNTQECCQISILCTRRLQHSGSLRDHWPGVRIVIVWLLLRDLGIYMYFVNSSCQGSNKYLVQILFQSWLWIMVECFVAKLWNPNIWLGRWTSHRSRYMRCSFSMVDSKNFKNLFCMTLMSILL